MFYIVAYQYDVGGVKNMKKALLVFGSALLTAAFMLTGCGGKTEPENPILSKDWDWDAHQTWWQPIGSVVQSAPDGYYLINRKESRVEYWDLQTDTKVPLCGKAECTHEDLDCNALLMLGIDPRFLMYQSDGLYMIGEFQQDKESVAALFRENLDGGGWEIVTTMQKMGKTDENSFRAGIRNPMADHGWLYYVYDRPVEEGDYIPALCRVKMEKDAKPELLYQESGEAYMIRMNQVSVYDGKVYFCSRRYSSETEADAGLYCYDPVSGETERLLDRWILSHVMLDGKLYYTELKQDGIFVYEPESGKVTSLVEDPASIGEHGLGKRGEMSADGVYLYHFNRKYEREAFPDQIEVNVFSPDGTLQEQILCPNPEGFFLPLWGDENYLFMEEGFNLQCWDKHKKEWRVLK